MTTQQLRSNFYTSLLSLSSEDGFTASSKKEVYGCLFGRDSAITILKILSLSKKEKLPDLLPICKKTLLTLVSLQGKEFNIESGEEPGKMIHEFRKDKYDHLLQLHKPWYVYPDGFLRNYDSIDSTSLILIAIYKYWDLTQDGEFLLRVLPSVESSLNWQISYGDIDNDTLLEYDFPVIRKYGGLPVQSWTDSHESLLTRDGKMPQYPIAPVEVQSYAWLALRLWSDYYSTSSPQFSQKLLSQAKKMKETFNKRFIIVDNNLYYAAQALDGQKNKISTITANPLLCLWSCYQKDSTVESIIDSSYINQLVERAFLPDIFESDAGIRTMSTTSDTYNPQADSYHNGSFWPMLNGLIIEGLENFGFTSNAHQLKKASTIPLLYFKSPIELYIKTPYGYREFCSPSGQVSCKEQTWSAACALDFLSD